MLKSDIYHKLKTDTTLPSPSEVVLKVMQLCYSDSSSLQDIAMIVEKDPALSAKFLQYANSAIMASSVPVASVQRAAVKIGLRGMVSLALSFSLMSQQCKNDCAEFNLNRFWSKSLAQAVAARALAQHQHTFDPDEVFTCALLSHIGQLALATAFPREYGEILAGSLALREVLEAEKGVFDLDHHELTAEMFADWGLPKPFGLAARIHEAYLPDQEEDDEAAELAEILYLSWNIANICVIDLPLTVSFETVEKLAEQYGVTTGTFPQFFEQIVYLWQEYGYVFQITTQHCPLYNQLKAFDTASIEEQVRNRENKTAIVILAVDDDPLTLLNLTRILNSPTRTVITAEDGREALRIALVERPEMIITDWRMPHLDGLDLCKALRHDASTQHSYIIMLTGVEAEDELVQAFDAGADDYVVKPFTPKVLEARIRSGERMIRYQRKINSDREVIEKYAARLGVANRKLHTMAMTDALTGLPNRRSAMGRLKDVVAESSRYNQKLSCIMIDIDHFKTINDTYGHECGDIVLREISQVFLRNARSYDMVSRMGGEEFLIICTRSDRNKSLLLAERLRQAVAQHPIQLGSDSSARVTISAGVASWDDDYRDSGEMIKAADSALYQAKQQGRNRVETAWRTG